MKTPRKKVTKNPSLTRKKNDLNSTLILRTLNLYATNELQSRCIDDGYQTLITNEL